MYFFRQEQVAVECQVHNNAYNELELTDLLKLVWMDLDHSISVLHTMSW